MKRNFFIVFFAFLFLFSMTSCHKVENTNTPDKSIKTKSESDSSIEPTENDSTPNTSSEESSVYALPDEVDIDETNEEEYDEDLYYGEEEIEDFADEEDKDSDNEENDNFDDTSNDNIEDNVSNNDTNESEDDFTSLNENH